MCTLENNALLGNLNVGKMVSVSRIIINVLSKAFSTMLNVVLDFIFFITITDHNLHKL